MLKVTEHKDVVRKNCLKSDWDTRYPGWILIRFSFISLEKFQDTACIRKTLNLSYSPIYYLPVDITDLSKSTPWRHMENGGRAPLILDLGIRRRRWSPFRPNRFTPDKEPQYPLNRRLGTNKSQCGLLSKGDNLLSLPRFEHRNFQHFASRYSPTVYVTEYGTWIFQFSRSFSLSTS